MVPGGLEDHMAGEHGVVPGKPAGTAPIGTATRPVPPSPSSARHADRSIESTARPSLVALSVTDPAWWDEGAVVEAKVPKPDADQIGTSSRSMVVRKSVCGLVRNRSGNPSSTVSGARPAQGAEEGD
jgi:hypothetical protein